MLDLSLIKQHTVPVENLDIFEEESVLDEAHLGKKIQRLGVHAIRQDERVDIALLGVPELRGSKHYHPNTKNSVHPIRAALYGLYEWHEQFKLLDLGDIPPSPLLQDTYKAVEIVAEECIKKNVLLIIIGGSHDLLIPQYAAFQRLRKAVYLCNIDALIDLDKEKRHLENTYLERLFFDVPKVLESYTHLGFQSYYTHPRLLAILDELNCSCMRLGFVKDQPYEVEPEIRYANLIAFDLAAISSVFCPVAAASPNGFSGEEACTLVRFAGMSERVKIMGIYGYVSFLSQHHYTAPLIAHMIWYFIEGRYFKEREGSSAETPFANCNTYYTTFNQLNTEFYQNKLTKRWWMRIHESLVVPCSYGDYKKAANNEIPERWLKYANV